MWICLGERTRTGKKLNELATEQRFKHNNWFRAIDFLNFDAFRYVRCIKYYLNINDLSDHLCVETVHRCIG